MGNKNILLWVVAGIAMVLSVIAIVAPKGQQSDASNGNFTATQSETLYQGGGGEVIGSPCVFWTADGVQHTGETDTRKKSDGTTEVVCRSGGFYGRNYILTSNNEY